MATNTEIEIKYPEALQALLTKTLGTNNVYFQPPSTIKMKYPCIVYQLDYMNSTFADNVLYRGYKRYQVTYIDSEPDMAIPDQIAQIPMCSFSRFFTAENRNHYVYKLYFKEVYRNG